MKPKRKVFLIKKSPKVKSPSMFDKLDLIRRQMDEGKYNLTAPTIMIDFFDPCEICGS